MNLTSTAFREGETIPDRNAYKLGNVSPALRWTEAPAGAKSFALIADDPDAPRGTWTHWVLFDLPPDTTELPEQAPAQGELASGARQGKNDFGEVGYGGPWPPPGKPHRYFFKLYALDTKLGLPAGATKAQVE